MIAERGFSLVAVEGDWPDCDRVDRAVRCASGAPEDPREALVAFERWPPTWMWANEEVSDSARRLRAHNTGLAPPRGVPAHARRRRPGAQLDHRQSRDTTVLLTYEGWGHGVHGRTPCVDTAVDTYLTTLTTHERNTRCAAVEPATGFLRGSRGAASPQ